MIGITVNRGTMKKIIFALGKQAYIFAGCLLLLFIFSGVLHAQSEEKDIFAPVTKSTRARLIGRLKLLTEYERAGRWAEMYDMGISPWIGGKDKYLSERKRIALELRIPSQWFVDFTPRRVHNEYIYGSGEKAQWRIDGLATVREGGCLVHRWAAVYIAYRDNDWYFSDFMIELPKENAPAKPCIDK